MGMNSVSFGSNPYVSGLLLISDGVLAGADIPGKANPYAHFQTVRPNAVIDRGVYVYEGQFNLGPAAALEHVASTRKLLEQGHDAEALTEAELAKDLDPASAMVWMADGDALEAVGRSAQAKAAYQNALHAPELDPVFQEDLLIALQGKSNR
jgi:tetratricopeptide (TPR) repeat protein